MALQDHVGTMIYSALLNPVENTKKKNKRMEYFCVVAYPPEARTDLINVLTAGSPNGSLSGLTVGVKTNSNVKHPHEGIPGDWLVVRATTGAAHPPTVFGLQGQPVKDVLTYNGELFSGQKVRMAARPFFWTNPEDKRDQGLSWTLDGVLAVGGGERRSGGEAVDQGQAAEDAFAKYMPAGAATQQATPANSGADPFQQAGGRQQAGGSSDPFSPNAPQDNFADDDIPF